MMRNIVSVGERSVCGKYGMIKAVGQLKIHDSLIRSLTAAGMVAVKKSTIKRVKITGELIGEDVQIKNLKVVGNARLNGICRGEKVIISGAFHADYLECELLCNKTDKPETKTDLSNSWSGVVYAETFVSYGYMKLDFEYHFKNIVSRAKLYSSSEIECERFYSLSDLSAKAVNAEHIFLMGAGRIKVEQLMGGSVMIKRSFRPDKSLRKITGAAACKKVNAGKNIADIKMIEADRVDIEYIKCSLVSGEHVRIGDLCIIDRVEYRSSIEISEKAVVNEVVKL